MNTTPLVSRPATSRRRGTKSTPTRPRPTTRLQLMKNRLSEQPLLVA
jgi:hypothetical protein